MGIFKRVEDLRFVVWFRCLEERISIELDQTRLYWIFMIIDFVFSSLALMLVYGLCVWVTPEIVVNNQVFWTCLIWKDMINNGNTQVSYTYKSPPMLYYIVPKEVVFVLNAVIQYY